jgi:hypothetical protein
VRGEEAMITRAVEGARKGCFDRAAPLPDEKS